MNLDLEPVKVDISVESISVDREAFYNLCFITENDEAPRTLEVSKLKDLLENGYDRFSLAYNFCVGVFAQQSVPLVYIRAKRSDESYEEAFDAGNNSTYYFISIQSKDLTVVSEFNDYINSSDNYKLQFYSSPSTVTQGKKLVQYYQKNLEEDSNLISDYYINKAFDRGYLIPDSDLATPEQLQQARLAYPESAWIGYCGNYFPSNIQWLYKYLAKVDIVKEKIIPDLTTTSSMVIGNKSIIGSGTTNQGIPIHEQISLDWVRWAISRRVWNSLYTKEKINSTKGGLDLITNDIRDVLEVAVTQGIFSDYQVIETKLNRSTNTIEVKFRAGLTYTILECNVSGSLYY